MPTTCQKEPRPTRARVSHERLHSLLSYNPETGRLCWLNSKGSRALAGQRAGTLGADGYRRIRVDGLNYLEHQLVWFYVHGVWVPELDHKNLKIDENWIDNLRVATRSQNSANVRAKSRNLLGVKGVSFYKRTGRYFARIRSTHLGYFKTPGEAAAAYAKAAEATFGEFART